MTEIAAAIQRLLTDPPDSESVASDLPLAPEIEEAEVAEQAMVLAMPMFIAVGGGPPRLSLVAEFSEGGAGAPLNHMAAATAGGLPTPSAPSAPLVLEQSQTANLASGLEAAEAMILPDLALGQGKEVKEGGAGGVQGFSIPGVAPQPSSRADLSLSAAMPVASDVTLNMNNQKAWNHTLGQQLVWMVQNHAQEAELKVNPAHLGPLEVRLSLHQDQADVTFFSHDAMVRDVLEQALPRLREMLSHHGVQLGQATVSDQSLARQQQEAGGRPSGQDAQEARGGGAAEAGLGEDPPPGFQHRPGIVDHYI